jgi:hypothetical protein
MMPSDTPFTIFRSAAEEAAMRIADQRWENEGGRMSSTAGYVTRLAGADLPYTAVLKRQRGVALERSFRTMREAEAFIRRHSPVPPRALSTLYDRPASES